MGDKSSSFIVPGPGDSAQIAGTENKVFQHYQAGLQLHKKVWVTSNRRHRAQQARSGLIVSVTSSIGCLVAFPVARKEGKAAIGHSGLCVVFSVSLELFYLSHEPSMGDTKKCLFTVIGHQFQTKETTVPHKLQLVSQ